MRLPRLILFAALPLLACAHAPPATGSAATTGSDDFAPMPYTAEQIRAASRPGRTYDLRMEEPGKPAVHHVTTFVSVTDAGAEIRTTYVDDSGQEIAPAKTTTPTWDEIRHHAAFPRDATTVDQAQVTVPAGTFDCIRYAVALPGKEVMTFYFAKNLPGAPVLFSTDRDGNRVMTAKLQRYVDSQ